MNHFKPMAAVCEKLMVTTLNMDEKGIYIIEEPKAEEFKKYLIKNRYYHRKIK